MGYNGILEMPSWFQLMISILTLSVTPAKQPFLWPDLSVSVGPKFTLGMKVKLKFVSKFVSIATSCACQAGVGPLKNGVIPITAL